MKGSSRNDVGGFLMRAMPQGLVEGLKLLAELSYPINDKRGFEDQLAKRKEESASFVKRVLGGLDFPIMTAESAFEKFHARYGPVVRLPPVLDLPGLDLPDFSYRPSACRVYERTFSAAAAACACKAYADALRQGLNQYQAIIIGHFTGAEAEETGVCPI